MSDWDSLGIGVQPSSDDDLQFGDLFGNWTFDGTVDDDQFQHLFSTDDNSDGAMHENLPLNVAGTNSSASLQTHMDQDVFSAANQDHDEQGLVTNNEDQSPFAGRVFPNEMNGQEQAQIQDPLEAPDMTTPDEQSRTHPGGRDIAQSDERMSTRASEQPRTFVEGLRNGVEHTNIVRQDRLREVSSVSHNRSQGSPEQKPARSRLHKVTPWKPSEGYLQRVHHDIFKHYRKNHPFLIQFHVVENFHRISKIPGIPVQPSPMQKAKHWAIEVVLQQIETDGIFEDLMGQMGIAPEDTDLELFKQTYQYSLAVARRLREIRQMRTRKPQFLQAFESEMTRILQGELDQGNMPEPDEIEALRQEVIIKLEIQSGSQTSAVADFEAEKNRILSETVETLQRSNIAISDQMYQSLVEGAETMARSRLDAAAASNRISMQRQSPDSTPDQGNTDGSGDEQDSDDGNGDGNGKITIPEILMRAPPRSRFDDPKEIAAISAKIAAQEAATAANGTRSSSPKKKRGRRSASTDMDEPDAKRSSPRHPSSKRASPKRASSKRTPTKKRSPSQRNNSTSSSAGSSSGVIVREDGSLFFQVKDMEAAKAHMMKYGAESSPVLRTSVPRTPVPGQSQPFQRAYDVNEPVQQQPNIIYGGDDTTSGPYAPGMSGRNSARTLFGGPVASRGSPSFSSGSAKRFVPLKSSTQDAPSAPGYQPSLSQSINAAQASRQYPVDLGNDFEAALSGVITPHPNSPEDEDTDY